jgi:DNA-binding LacI/PurR family transcriptional regulator
MGQGPHCRRHPSKLAYQQSLKALLLANTPSIVNLLSTKGLSALVALNDGMAIEIHLWLKFAGIRVPRDLSIVSFDNAIDYYHLPISTVDFGFARLGYQAAHVFIGDIPVRSGADGDMPGACTVIDKGSIGTPGLRRNTRKDLTGLAGS